jgi:O-phosphoseryl-tRNA(Cys) synthetase
VPDLPRPIVEYGAHPVDQSTTAPVPRGAVTLLEADVDTTPARTERAAAAPHEFRDNRNIASTTATLRDELPTGLRMPLSSIIAKKPPTKTFFDQESTRRETGEFVRR